MTVPPDQEQAAEQAAQVPGDTATGFSPGVAEALGISGLDPRDVLRVIETALAEDLRYGPDATTQAVVGPGTVASGTVSTRTDGVLAGLPVARALLERAGGGRLALTTALADGARLRAGDVVGQVRGPARDLLTVERTLLNLLCHLSGIATLTRRWVDAVAGTRCAIRDSRKTLPGLRLLEKYAVRCGGGVNHRLGLGDAVLIKDNHIELAGSVTAALQAARRAAPDLPCEVEVTSLEELARAVRAGAGLVLLDNFEPADCERAVEALRGSGVRLEASGGLALDRAAQYAATGVDYLAVGALTHSAPALDLGLDM
jgi:nicotinate-nucleotide pyrophosphorylase (carboxylating)